MGFCVKFKKIYVARWFLMDMFVVHSKALERKVKISNSNGMHARPATKFAEIANKYSSEIYVKTKNKEIGRASCRERV